MKFKSIDQMEAKSSLRPGVELNTWPGVGHVLIADPCPNARTLVEKVRLPKFQEISKA